MRMADLTDLRGVLSLLRGDDSAAQRCSAELSLVANVQGMKLPQLRRAMSTLRDVVSYSASLQRYPLVKQAFWEQVLASELMASTGGRRAGLRLKNIHFPRLVLDFSRTKVTAGLLEALADYLQETEQRALEPTFSGVKVQQKQQMQCVPVTLKFIRCRLTAELIGLLRNVVALEETRGIVHEGVRFCVTSLDLSENAMGTEELNALADLLHDCSFRGERKSALEELVLEKVVGRSLTTENWAAFRRFVQAAFGISRPATSGPGSKKVLLKRLSLANNSFSHHHIACICSALRFEDTALEELSLAHSFSLVDPADRETSWMWLAIGLHRLPWCDAQSGLKRLDLSGNPVYPRDSAIWLESLGDPSAMIASFHELPSTAIQAGSRTCFLSDNSVLFSLPDTESPRLRIIEKEVAAVAATRQWEVLGYFQLDTRWICVTVPSFGIAWTEAKYATFPERQEDSDLSNLAVLAELVLNDMTAALTSAEAVKSFASGFGGHLQSLEMRHNTLGAEDLDAILSGCSELHDLDVEGCRLLNVQLLSDALLGDLGQHLRTLNLNGNLIGAEATGVLAAALRGEGPGTIPELQELRLARNEIGADGVRHIHSLLGANKHLELLELDLPTDGVGAGGVPPQPIEQDDFMQLYRTRCMRLDVAFQHELLGVTPFPLDHKVAFLQVLNALDIALDQGVCSIIFSLAAEERRRCIVWNSAHR